MYTLEFSVDSEKDIEAIFLYSLSAFGEIHALKYQDELQESLMKVLLKSTIGHIRNDWV